MYCASDNHVVERMGSVVNGTADGTAFSRCSSDGSPRASVLNSGNNVSNFNSDLSYCFADGELDEVIDLTVDNVSIFASTIESSNEVVGLANSTTYEPADDNCFLNSEMSQCPASDESIEFADLTAYSTADEGISIDVFGFTPDANSSSCYLDASSVSVSDSCDDAGVFASIFCQSCYCSADGFYDHFSSCCFSCCVTGISDSRASSPDARVSHCLFDRDLVEFVNLATCEPTNNAGISDSTLENSDDVFGNEEVFSRTNFDCHDNVSANESDNEEGFGVGTCTHRPKASKMIRKYIGLPELTNWNAVALRSGPLGRSIDFNLVGGGVCYVCMSCSVAPAGSFVFLCLLVGFAWPCSSVSLSCLFFRPCLVLSLQGLAFCLASCPLFPLLFFRHRHLLAKIQHAQGQRNSE